MKLEKVLENLNSFEKNSFLKIIDNIVAGRTKNNQSIEQIFTDSSRDLKNIDHINIVKVFKLVEDEFANYVKEEFINPVSQLDILIDIISRDGNCIIKQDWFARLYENELSTLNKKIKEFEKSIEDEKSEISAQRQREYKIYRACVHTAYHNDTLNNQEQKITINEQLILLTLSNQLALSQEEVKLIKYMILPIQRLEINTVINNLKSLGIIFYTRKTNTIYIADEMVRLLRKVRGKDIADKFFRRILRLLREAQINLVCKKYRINWRVPLDDKIKKIINEGIPLSDVLIDGIHKKETKVMDKKKFVNNLFDKGLSIYPPLKGTIIKDKITSLIKYFEDIEKDEKVYISIDGYEKMLIEMGEVVSELNQQLKSTFELQEEHVLKSNYLLDYNIKPQDVLEIVPEKELDKFCQVKQISTRGNLIHNILDAYKDAENIYLENYENIGFRNLAALKENGLSIRESDLGVKFEELTKKIFSHLGFNVDEVVRKKLNTRKDKIDVLINLGNNDLILIECKTIKESGYNKFSSVSRQLKAYTKLAKNNNFKVIKSLLIAPDFSDDFIKSCGLEYELNLSLITASSLIKILKGFKNSKHKQFPHNLLMRDVLIQEERVVKAIEK